MMTEKIYFDDLGVKAQISSFTPKGGVHEFHAILQVDPRNEPFVAQLRRMYEGEARLYALPQVLGSQTVFKRYFLSDSTNQRPLMKEEDGCACSFIQQSPLDGSKLGVWIYMQRGTNIYTDNGMLVSEHNGYRHLWKMGMVSEQGDSAQQTTSLLKGYEADLQRFNVTLADNCIRTWFFVRDVDTQYAGMVKARRENFEEQGLTPQTHFIASTGIGGLPAPTRALIQLDTYAVIGLQPAQQRYLYAPTHLNPTYQYGVTFERGVCLEYGDRSHVYISGTASINNKGEVLHVGDVVKQTKRMWENVETLLAEADTSFDNVMQIIVYLRDVADYAVVNQLFTEKFPSTPFIITQAPVCRPTWLIEMECVAVKERTNPQFPNL